MFFSYAGRRVSSPVVNRSRLLFALLMLMSAHLALQGRLLPLDAEPFRWGWLALSGFLGLALGDAALFQALVLIGPRLSMLMMSLVPIISTAIGRLVFHEWVSSAELVGIALAIGGVSWVVTEDRGGDSPTTDRDFKLGLLLALGGALGQAVNLATAKYGLVGDFPTISATLIRILVATVAVWLFAAWRGRVRPTLDAWRDRRALATILAGTSVGPFLGVWLSMVAVQSARLGIASTLMALPPVLLIPIEFAVYGHRVSARATIGTLAAFAGVTAILLS